MRTIKQYLDHLLPDHDLYFKVEEADRHAFWLDCQKAGVTRFYTGRPFLEKDVQAFMVVRKDQAAAYSYGQMFYMTLGGVRCVSPDGTEIIPIHIDYARMIHTDEECIMHWTEDHPPLLNGIPLPSRLFPDFCHEEWKKHPEE